MIIIHKKNLIKKCNELSQHFIDEGIQFRALAQSIEQNTVRVDLKEFINKRYKAFLEIQE